MPFENPEQVIKALTQLGPDKLSAVLNAGGNGL
jgi:hypothetical protein